MAKKKQLPRGTEAEMAKKVAEFYDLILSGAGRAKLLQYGAKNWGLADRSIDDIASRARKLLEKDLAEKQTSSLSKHIKRREALRITSLETGRLDLCLSIDQDLARLQGLYPTEKHKLQLEDARTLSDFLSGKPLSKPAGKDVTPADDSR